MAYYDEMTTADLTQITRWDVPLLPATRPRFPKGSIKGEFRNHAGHYVADVYVVNHRVYLAIAREFGNGEIERMIPGSFDPRDFERAGGMQWTSTKYIKFWRFKA